MFKLNYTAGFMPGASARRSLLITAMLFCAACQQQPDPPTQAPIEAPMPWFVEMAGKMGLDFIHRSGHDGNRYLLPESASGGGALFDMDGDGFLDIYLVQSAESSGQTPGNRLYRNDGGNRFVDVTAASGAGGREGSRRYRQPVVSTQRRAARAESHPCRQPTAQTRRRAAWAGVLPTEPSTRDHQPRRPMRARGAPAADPRR